MFDAMRSLQQSVHSLLAQDSEIMSRVGAVYDQLPMDAAWPCLVFGQADARDWSTKTAQGTQVLLDLHVFSDQPGRAEALAILDRVSVLLHEQQLAMENLMVVAKRVEQGQLPSSSAEDIVQGTVRLKAFLEKTNE